LLKAGKTLKSVTHNVAGSLVKGRALKQSPLEELESLLATWFKQARGSNAVISGALLREKALHIATRFGIEDFKASNGWINGFKQQHSVVYKTVLGEC
jgi:hypothetical protein